MRIARLLTDGGGGGSVKEPPFMALPKDDTP